MNSGKRPFVLFNKVTIDFMLTNFLTVSEILTLFFRVNYMSKILTPYVPVNEVDIFSMSFVLYLDLQK